MSKQSFFSRYRIWQWRLLAVLLIAAVSFTPLAAYADLEDVPSDESVLSDNAPVEIPDAPEFKEGDDVFVEADEIVELDPVRTIEGISLSLSDPEIWIEGDTVFYRTVLTAEGANSFFGYQVEVEASGQDEVEVNGLYDGIKTDPVYKDNNLYLASMGTNVSSGDISACEIVVKYPMAEVSDSNQLVVRSFQVVTSISPEAIITFGPEPAAAVLNLPVPTNTFNWMPFVILGALFLIVALLVLWFVVRKTSVRRSR